MSGENGVNKGRRAKPGGVEPEKKLAIKVPNFESTLVSLRIVLPYKVYIFSAVLVMALAGAPAGSGLRESGEAGLTIC